MEIGGIMLYFGVLMKIRGSFGLSSWTFWLYSWEFLTEKTTKNGRKSVENESFFSGGKIKLLAIK